MPTSLGRIRLVMIASVVSLAVPGQGRAEIYRCVDAQGQTAFADKPCPSATKSSPPVASTDVRARDAAARADAASYAGLPAVDRMKSCQPSIALGGAEDVAKALPTSKDPVTVYSAALVLLAYGRGDDALFWYYAAQLRARQQWLVEGGDSGQVLQTMQSTIGVPLRSYATQDTARQIRAIDKAIAWDRNTPNPWAASAKAAGKQKEFDEVAAGLVGLRDRLTAKGVSGQAPVEPAGPKPQEVATTMLARRCGSGEPDPAFAARKVDEEKGRVERLVAANGEIVQAAGLPIQQVSVAGYTKSPGSREPTRYDVSITGQKSLFAQIDVDRRDGPAVFRLACVTQLAPGQRYAGDVCTYGALPSLAPR